MPDLIDQISGIGNKPSAARRKTTASSFPSGLSGDPLADLNSSFKDPDESGVVATVGKEAAKSFAGFGIDAVRAIEQLFPEKGRPIGDQDFIADELREALGSSLDPGQGAAATVGQAIGGVAPSFILGATVGLPATIGIFALSNFGRAIKEADDAGLDDAAKFSFAAANAGLAPAEAIPVGKTLAFLDKGTGGFVRKLASKSRSTSIKKLVEVTAKHKSGRALIAALQAAPEEAAQEAFLSQIPENVLAKAFGVDPDRGLFEGAGRAALLGAIGGGVGAAAISPFSQGRTDAIQDQETGGPNANVRQLEGAGEGQDQVSEQVGGEGVREVGQAQATEEITQAIEQIPAQSVEPETVSGIPTTAQVVDFSQPRKTRVSKSRIASVKAKPGVKITTGEGTIYTTPKQSDLRLQASAVLGRKFEVPGRGKTTGQQLANEARRLGIPDRAKLLADERNTSSDPVPFTPIEQMGLDVRLEDAKMSLRDINKEISQTTDHDRTMELGTAVERLDEEIMSITRALDVNGSVIGLALRTQRFLVNELFNVSTLEARAAASKQKPLTPDERRLFKEAVAKMEDLQNRLDAAEARVEQQQAEAELRNASRTSRKEPGKRRRRSRSELGKHVSDIKRLAKAGC